MEPACRLCIGKTEAPLILLDKENDLDLNVAAHLLDCTAIELCDDVDYPFPICEDCKFKLLVFYRFKNTCRKNYNATKKASIQNEVPVKDDEQELYHNIEVKEELSVECESEMFENPYGSYPEACLDYTEGMSRDEEEDCKKIQQPVVRVYECQMCDEKVLGQSNLKDHYDTSHIKDLPYKCKTCGIRFETLNGIFRHRSYHIGDRPHKCETCSKTFKTSGELKTHVNTHKQLFLYRCKHCEAKFNYSSNLRRHMKVHNIARANVKCSICFRIFADAFKLRQHTRYAHEKDFTHQCNICFRRWQTEKSLNSHKKEHQDRVFKCPICPQDRRFKTCGYLKTHMMNSHGQDVVIDNIETKSFVCHLCDRPFHNKSNLTRHLRNFHTKEKPAVKVEDPLSLEREFSNDNTCTL